MSRALSPVLLEAPNRNVVEVRLEMILHVHPFKTIGGLRNRRFTCFQYIWPLPGSIFALFCICMLFITINSFWFLFCVSVACKIHCSCFGDVNFKDVCCDCSTDNGPAMWRKKKKTLVEHHPLMQNLIKGTIDAWHFTPRVLQSQQPWV